MGGRSTCSSARPSNCSRCSRLISTTLFAKSPLAISLNVQEFHPVLNFKKNNLHEHVKRRGGKP